MQHESRTKALADFVDWCSKHITGDEKGQAQIFLDRLFIAFGQKGSLDVGGAPELRIRKAKEDGGGTAFADYVWKPVVLIEMKKRGADLSRHYRQAFDYWTRLVPGRPKYVVLCNFDEFHVYDFDTQLDTPKDVLKLADLPHRYGPLAFLFPTAEAPVFENDREAVTRKAADYLAECFRKLITRKVPRDLAQRFILQSLMALFAEDIGLLERYTFAHLLEDIQKPADAWDLLGGLFVEMNTPGVCSGGRFKGVKYFNGGLFREPARLPELHPDELAQLKSAAREDWSKVSPEIFGELFQKSMDAEERHAFGAHFTYPTDIMKIVKPTIVDPWSEAIESAKSGKRLSDLLDRLAHLRILDPACGSGNFLYLAYREMKRLEARLRERLTTEFPGTQPRLSHVNAKQFFGIDINPFAIELAKVTMTIGRKLAIDELHIVDEPALPLDNLDANFVVMDALISDFGLRIADCGLNADAPGAQTPSAVGQTSSAGGQTFLSVTVSASGDIPVPRADTDPAPAAIPSPWPVADVIIGNPPFLGAKRLKPERGVDYVNAVRKLYGDVPGMADYCVYWIRRAHDHLPDCTKADPFAGRAGLVGTQNIRNNQSRVGGLDHVVTTGTIIEAVDNQPWSGEANVHVSIVNWVKTKEEGLLPGKRKLWRVVTPPTGKKPKQMKAEGPTSKIYELDVRVVNTINSSLSDDADLSRKSALECNKLPKRCFQGKIPGYEGFMLTADDVRGIGGTSEVVVPYLTGRELLDEFRIARWAIDFGNRDMAQATAFSLPFAHVREHVLPSVQASYEQAKRDGSDMVSARREHLDRWWQFWNRRDELSAVLARMHRCIVCSRVTRRPVMVFLSATICPSDLLQIFAFEDDYSFGILQSGAHFEWFRKSSRLKVESDIRYSVRDIFETFPWPQFPEARFVTAVAAAARKVRRVREDLLKERGGGLRDLYRVLDLPGRHPLRAAHDELDSAVNIAYGFHGDRPLLDQILQLNQTISESERAGRVVCSPGIPNTVAPGEQLISQDCYKE